MIRSMTGYSRSRSEGAEFAISVSVKTTNHRFLDLQVRLPAALEPLEPFLRRLLKDYITRGHVEMTVNLEQIGLCALELNRELLKAYAGACKQLREEFGFAAQPDPVSLLRIPGMLAAGNGLLAPEQLERIQKILESVTVEALQQLNMMRGREGEELGRDLRSRVERLGELSKNIELQAARFPQLYQQRLEHRIKELAGNLELDRGRVAQEVAFLAARSDISEELTRLRSHLIQARQLLEATEIAEAGRKFDFLLQEMNREANTVLSKTTDVPEVGLEVARQAIEMKTEIEKLREQAQNIE